MIAKLEQSLSTHQVARDLACMPPTVAGAARRRAELGGAGPVRHLFEPSQLNGMELKNRIIRSATWTGMADDTGRCSRQLIRYYESLAKGGAGLIVTGHAYVTKDGQAGPRQLAIDSDEAIPALRELTEAVHGSGGRIVMQLSHAGMYADPQLTLLDARAVSVNTRYTRPRSRELTPECIELIVQAFVAGARHAEAAGFDGVQIHAAHGYLFNQFLSPAYNLRQDGYGGELHNRSKPLLAVVRGIRASIGRNYPVLVKLNSQDFVEGGLTIEDSLTVAVMLEQEGVDAIEVTGGTRESGRLKSTRTSIVSEEDEAYFEHRARRFKERLRIPIVLVGGIRRHETAVRLLDTGAADYVAMSRPFIREPDFVNRWRSGNTAMVDCTSDNGCLALGLGSGGIRCSR
jgi:2,4-dienoyl-CoA reductase-like NADH-dependent reductase (Old Yellow Enzyme family)